jgi:hypothetical protein
MKLHVESNI